ncbi:uncharacterized protein PV09_09621 [Verruconis gallopava]|uniref:Ribosomal protein L22 n=1 Tax=Verruconis gallopava TaxID=253628 RepID=A0A0D1ZVV9_9PEZI|nr:uncharacterized protein PV09_09621 [Verruconis gallopava]KIV98587.1 hypothetical protein PV09_09621 [Verruconis gallopava]
MASRAVQRTFLEPGHSLSHSINSICPPCRFASLTIRHSPRLNYSSNTAESRREPENHINSHLQKYLKKAPSSLLQKELDSQKECKETESADLIARGLPSKESIFDSHGESPSVGEQAINVPQPSYELIDPEALLNVLDPEPSKRLSWQRRKVIQQIRKRGEFTKAEIIKRTERECMVSSAMFKTSTKKLVHLARQIAGKPIDDAIAQMQLSKKRVAQDIMKHLEYAKTLAIVSRGMGLGKVENRAGEPVEIETKNGKRKLVTDRTSIYVDQAWVNKGDHTITAEYRGKGKVYRHKHRTAKITVLLKEEATRVRQWQEREEKLKNRKLWLHLPDRPITLQRQYPLW